MQFILLSQVSIHVGVMWFCFFNLHDALVFIGRELVAFHGNALGLKLLYLDLGITLAAPEGRLAIIHVLVRLAVVFEVFFLPSACLLLLQRRVLLQVIPDVRDETFSI